MALAGVFAAGTILLSAFIYWETVGYLTRRVDSELQDHAQAIAGVSSAARIERVQRYLETDVRLLKIAGLFDASGQPLAGNLRGVPPGLPVVGRAGDVEISDIDGDRIERQSIRVLAVQMPDGNLLVLGRSVRAVEEISEIVTRALLLALVPTILLGLIAGVVLSRGAVSRIAAVHRTSRLIMAGQLGERLPTRGRNDDFDKLARIVNEMLDEIERLMAQAKGAGEDIAHDLRTPLTRLRGRIERTLSVTAPESDLAGSLEAAIGDIDQILGTITAILRIAEVEHGQRRAGFRDVDLADVIREAADLYEPVAEAKGVTLTVGTGHPATTRGDGDLLFEAVANLLDNAIKFTPAGSDVEVMLRHESEGPSIRVSDEGPGIPAADFPRVLRRFQRGDRSRRTPGTGLGLSLVASIARLHGFGLVVRDHQKGFSIELHCWAHDRVSDEDDDAAMFRPRRR